MGLPNVYGVPGLGRRRAATVIDGREMAAAERKSIAGDVASFVAKQGVAPALATILIGDDPASAVYVESKIDACEEVGLESVHHKLPADVGRDRVLRLIASLNADPTVSGILCQLPVPGHLDGTELANAIDPAKDVDGLTIASAGRLTLGLPGLRPCTPLAVMTILARAAVDPGKRLAVVVGRSNLFGKPMAQMLTAADATVTLGHSRTPDLPSVCRHADILIVAVGRPKLVGPDWIKPGATVIDVGISRSEDGLVGDVDFEAAAGVAGAITPVPGGVGPMTIASLLRNTVDAANLAAEGTDDLADTRDGEER